MSTRRSIVHAHDQGGEQVRLVLSGGEEVELPYRDCFFVRAPELDRLPRSFQSDAEVEGDYARVYWPDRSRSSRAARLKYFKEAVFDPRGVVPLEADVSPVQRFLVERPDLALADDLRLLYFDLETEQVADWERPWNSRVLSFSWRSSRGKHGHVRAVARTDAAERELLRVLAKLMDRHDVLLAWNGERFDFPVVRSRAALLGVPFEADLHHWLDHLRVFKKYFLKSEDGSATSSFSLDAIAEALLGEKKVDVKAGARARGYDGKSDLFVWLWERAPDLFEAYNDQDVALMEKLEARTGFVQMHLAVCRLCRVLPGGRSVFPMTLVDGRLLIRGHEAGYHFPSRIKEDEPQARYQARGAYVPEADVGLHASVPVLDFARMYPSIIRTLNLSIDALDPDGAIRVPDTDERGRPNGKVIARFRAAPEGHLPAALGGILAMRRQYDEKRARAEIGSPEWHDAGRLSNGCKVIANAFYGVVLNPVCRIYHQAIGESVTSTGRRLLRATIDEAASRGHKLVFGDTDSIAFSGTCAEATALKEAMNGRVIPELVATCGVAPETSSIAVDYEKRYAKILITASKRYAGIYAVYKGAPAKPGTPMDVRGLEIVRSDVCRAARGLQRAVLEQVLADASESDLYAYALRRRQQFFEAAAPLEDLLMSKGISKPLDDYKVDPLQVRLAKQMRDEGLDVGPGSKIPFVFVPGKGAVLPSEITESGVDVYAYWNKYVWPPTERVLAAAFPRRDWGKIVLDKRSHVRGQAAFLFEEAPPPEKPRTRKVRTVKKDDPPPTRRTRPPPLVLRGASGFDPPRLRAALESHPGARPVVLVLRDGGLEATIACPQRVDGSPALLVALLDLGLAPGDAGGDDHARHPQADPSTTPAR